MRELLLLTIDNQQYGIWKDEIVSVRDIHTLHRIPLSPPCIAGMTIIDDRTMTLADLPVCIGYAPAAGNGKGRVLVLPGGEKIASFIISGDIEYASVPDDAVFPMPGYLASDVIDSCAVRGNVPVPIINVLNLSSQLLKSDHELPRPALALPHRESGPTHSVRIFELRGEPYAASSAGMEERSTKIGDTACLALVPQYVNGITFYSGTVMPVIDLCRRVKREKSNPGACMIVGDISGAKFGLLADEDRGTWAAGDIVISDLPPIARSSSIYAAVLKEGEIIPLLDLAALLSLDEEDRGEKPLERGYTSDSQFDTLFKRQDVDVVEFLLLGARHALPKSEVEDVLPFTAYRQVPDTPEIVVGVAEHDGKLLPVLDLAMVFGRRSLTGPAWRMMLVKNGDFRALVITEDVFGERRLPLDIQRDVPILLPHRVVYGCYPEAEAVRLILNVEAIAVHFEKSLVQELLPALSQEMKQAQAEMVPSLLDEAAKAAFISEAAKPVEPGPQPVPVPPVEVIAEPALSVAESSSIPESVSKPEEVSAKEQEEEKPKQEEEEIVEQAGEQEPAAALTESVEKQETILPVADASAVPVSEIETPSGEDAETLEDAEKPSEEYKGSETAAVPVPDKAASVIEDTIQVETRAEEGTEQAVASVPDIPEQAPVEVQEKAAEEPIVEREYIIQAPQEVTASINVEQKSAQPGPETESEPQREPEPAVVVSYHDTTSELSEKSWKRFIGIGAIAALLAALLYFVGNFKKPDIEKPMKETRAPKAEVVKTEAKAQPVVVKQEPPLVLEVPPTKPTNIDVYVVVKGDTLWSISERFTGNPFNYPRIAGENKIANPDLIFPGQRIRLVKK